MVTGGASPWVILISRIGGGLGGEPVRHQIMQREISIGRASSQDIVLPDRSVSNQHARLQWVSGEPVIADTGSTNGVYVDGERITGPRPLRGGEEISVGTFVLVLRSALDEPTDVDQHRGPQRPARLYIGYAQEDVRYREGLCTHLASLRREGVISAWHDEMLTVGTARMPRLLLELDRADVVVLLVSAHYLASDHCATIEMSRAFERQRAGRCSVLPVLVRSVTLAGTPLDGIQLLPPGGLPVSRWSDQDEAWVQVVIEIRRRL